MVENIESKNRKTGLKEKILKKISHAFFSHLKKGLCHLKNGMTIFNEVKKYESSRFSRVNRRGRLSFFLLSLLFWGVHQRVGRAQKGGRGD